VTNLVLSPAAAASHLTTATWQRANRTLVAKAIREFTHELLITPSLERVENGVGEYRLLSDAGDVEYRFRAHALELDHLRIDESSLVRSVRGGEAPLDALSLVIELAERLAMPERVMASYLEELSSTLSAAAFKLQRDGHSSRELAHADFQTLESAMSEGHPCFVANNGRLGFDAADYASYAPECARPITLVWVAAHRSRSDFACVGELSYDALIHDELTAETRARFADTLRTRGLHAESYLYLPLHPWQWQNRIAQLYAPDLASGALVYLGRGLEQYRAQQSIRTLFNLSQPEKHYVKTALSIVNMGFHRGMSASIVDSSAAVNDWAHRLVAGDPYLHALGFEVLREVAFIGFRHRHYERSNKKRVDPHKDTLAALWRESPIKRLRKNERLMTMAALVYVDAEADSLLVELVRASGIGVDGWLRAYLAAYLKPQLHCFYAHRLVFTPHAENLLLVLEDDIVKRTFIKDIAEDIGVLNPTQPLAPELSRLALRVPEDVMTLSIFTDIFDCWFRFVAALLTEKLDYPEEKFWGLVADCVHDYEQSQPALRAEFRRYDLFAPTFIRNCLNRLQLADNELMIDLNAPDPVESLQFRGVLSNPIAPFAARGTPSQERDNHASQ
jgi:siderophore synthetase component